MPVAQATSKRRQSPEAENAIVAEGVLLNNYYSLLHTHITSWPFARGSSSPICVTCEVPSCKRRELLPPLLPAELVEGTALSTLADEHCEAFRRVAPERPLGPEGERCWGSLCSGSEGAHFVMAAAQAAYRKQGLCCSWTQGFACESNKDVRTRGSRCGVCVGFHCGCAGGKDGSGVGRVVQGAW